MLDHLLSSADPIRSAALEKSLQDRRARRQEVPEHVHLAPGCDGRELAAADHSDTMTFASRQGLGDAGQGVVIGESNGPKTGPDRAPYHPLGRNTPIGRSRMDVQIDRFARAG